ncbi:hypothetical protein [Nitriliruptor alkaliphilus]|uniref:hypothetical protein n=1 Tax=Nitriliruptor alkaliphilus TaxID=427918 RepID=UPI000698B533|nr:hypothetical protein [Nitriliruptor alkaliphilus]
MRDRGGAKVLRRLGRWLGAFSAVAAVAGGVARVEVDTSLDSFVPAEAPDLRGWERTGEAFGSDPLVVLIETDEPGALLDQDLVATINLEGRLAGLEAVRTVYGPATTVNQGAQRAQELLAEISGRRDGLREMARQEVLESGGNEAAAERAAEASVVAFDQRYLRLLAGGLDAGLPTLRNPAFVRAVVFGDTGQVRPDFRWLLPSPHHASILVRPAPGLDQAEVAELVEQVTAMVDETVRNVDGWSGRVTGAPVVTAALAEQVRRELPRAVGLGLLAMAGGLAVGYRVPWRRRFVPLGVAVVATAVTAAAIGWAGVPLSIGALAFLPIMFGVAPDLAIYAARRGSPRVLITAAGASAAAFATLAFSPVPFVRSLGLTLSVGVLVAAAIGLYAARSGDPGQVVSSGAVTDLGDRGLSAGAQVRLRPRSTLSALVLGAVLAVGALGWALLPSAPMEGRPQALAAGLPATEILSEAERILGASGEVSVRIDAEDLRTPEIYAWFRQVDAVVAAEFGDRLRPIVTPGRVLRFLGQDPTPEQVVAGIDVLPNYLVHAVISADGRSAVAQFGLRLGDLTEQQQLFSDLRARLPRPPDNAEVEVTGLPVVAARSAEVIGDRRILANLAGILAAVSVFAVALRHRRRTILAGLVCLVAFGWLLVALRAVGIPLSPITVVLGGLVAAVGGEYAVVGTRVRSSRGRRFGSVEAAAITSISVFLTLLASQLTVLRQLGMVLAAAVSLAYASARVLEWGILPEEPASEAESRASADRPFEGVPS